MIKLSDANRTVGLIQSCVVCS